MITNWLTAMVSWCGDCFEFLDTFYVLGTISALDLIVIAALTGMLINMFINVGKS